MAYTNVTSNLLTTFPPSFDIGTAARVGAVAWSNSTWARLLAAQHVPIRLWGVSINIPALAGDEFEMDIASGPGGSEVVIATFAAVGFTQAGVQEHISLPVPIDISVGVTLWARFRTASTTANLSAQFEPNYEVTGAAQGRSLRAMRLAHARHYFNAMLEDEEI